MTRVANWVTEFSTSVGTGPVLLTGPVTPDFTTFLEAFSAGTVYYAIKDGDNREAGIGTFDGTDTITRDTVLATLVSGVYNELTPVPITLVTRQAIVSCTMNAGAFRSLLTIDTFNTHVDGSDVTLKHKALDTVYADVSGNVGAIDVQNALDNIYIITTTKMVFLGKWIPQPYFVSEMVEDQGYLAVALFDNSERPAPNLYDDPVYPAASLNPTWATNNVVDSVVESVHNYTFILSGLIQELLLWSPTGTDGGHSFQVYVDDITIPASPVQLEIVKSPKVYANGWTSISVRTHIIKVNSIIRVKLVQSIDAFSNNFRGSWNLDNMVGTGDPGAGLWGANNAIVGSVTNVRVSSLDIFGDDRSSDITNIQIGSTIKFTQHDDDGRFALFTVSGALLPGGTFYTIPVNLGVQGSVGLPIAGQPTNMEILINATGTTDYVQAPSLWISPPSFMSVSSELYINGIPQVIDANDGFGIDIVYQRAGLPTSWELLPFISGRVGSGLGGGGGGGAHPGVDDTATGPVLFLTDANTGVTRQFDATIVTPPQIKAKSGSTGGIAAYRLENGAGEFFDIQYNMGSGEGFDHFFIRDNVGVSKFSLRNIDGNIGVGDNNYNPPGKFGVLSDSQQFALQSVSANVDVAMFFYEAGSPRWGFIGQFADLTDRFSINSYGAGASGEVFTVEKTGEVTINKDQIPTHIKNPSIDDLVIKKNVDCGLAIVAGASNVALFSLGLGGGANSERFICSVSDVTGQVKIESTLANSSVEITNQGDTFGVKVKEAGGVVLRSMNTTERNAILNKEPGEEIYNNATNEKQYWNGTNWMVVNATIAP